MSKKWHVSDKEEHPFCYVAAIRDDDDNLIGEAGKWEDAVLMAAAPELLEALESTLRWLRECEAETGKPIGIGYRGNMQKPVVVQKIKDAILKAKGEL